MPNGKHSRTEIQSKLAQANDLAAQGRLQSDIARTLGISVMTLHRWRKAATPMPPAVTNETTQFEHELGQGSHTEETRLENSRLRRLVTDLLLEKMKLEEAASANRSTRRASV
jgi:putative transposase